VYFLKKKDGGERERERRIRAYLPCVFFKRKKKKKREGQREEERERQTSLPLFKGLKIEPKYITLIINKILKKPLVF
jgi:hypothetical protein